MEIGCGNGTLLAHLSPSIGFGIDFSARMLPRKETGGGEIVFVQADAHHLPIAPNAKIDVVILSDLLNDVWDVQAVLDRLRMILHSRSRIVINTYNRMWEPIISLGDRLGLVRPNLAQNWLTTEDLTNLLHLTGFEVIRHWEEILWPFDTPLLAALFNKVLARLWPLKYFALSNFLIARPQPCAPETTNELSVSVIIPARNESGNIAEIFRRMPDFGVKTELIFVEGHSQDDTFREIQRQIEAHPDRECMLLEQCGEGKGDAVRTGFDHASGEFLMILDADLAVSPEDLPRFYHALLSKRAEFANGVRLVYPMEAQAMRFANLLGNKAFTLLLSWAIGQPVKDTLCGTKALLAEDYKMIASQRGSYGGLDPFGDFDLLLGAARLNLRIRDIPVRYRARVYGTTNIHRWRHGVLLLRMLWRALRQAKFV
jgi:hypothetical protein